jgi:hypothetical protein
MHVLYKAIKSTIQSQGLDRLSQHKQSSFTFFFFVVCPYRLYASMSFTKFEKELVTRTDHTLEFGFMQAQKPANQQFKAKV